MASSIRLSEGPKLTANQAEAVAGVMHALEAAERVNLSFDNIVGRQADTQDVKLLLARYEDGARGRYELYGATST